MIDISTIQLCKDCKEYKRVNERDICGYFVEIKHLSPVTGEIWAHLCATCTSVREDRNKSGGQEGKCVHFNLNPIYAAPAEAQPDVKKELASQPDSSSTEKVKKAKEKVSMLCSQ